MSTTAPDAADRVPAIELRHRLVIARDLERVSQEGMGAYLGLAGATISRYEKGQQQPKLQTLRLWALRCGVSFSWLVAGDPDLTPEQAIQTLGCSPEYAGQTLLAVG